MHSRVNTQMHYRGCHYARMNLLRQNVERYLEQKGWSVSYFAKLAKVSQPTMQRMLAGNIKAPSIETVTAIAERLNVSIDDLVRRELFVSQGKGVKEDPPPRLKIVDNGSHAATEVGSMIESLGKAGMLAPQDLRLLGSLARRLAR